MVAMAEELIGGEARIVECNAHINSRPAGLGPDNPPQDGFHTGSDVPFATHEKNGLTHFTFVKTLTNLTDLGPDDGGTIVIPGSHKINLPNGEIIAAAQADRSLITQVEAPAGSTLLFSETLIHSGQPVRSDKERAVIITGYASRLFPYWDMGPPFDGPPFSEQFAAGLPENMRTLFLGRPHWGRNARYRQFSEPADLRQFNLGTWNERE